MQSMNKPIVVANWKMNPSTLVEAKRLFDSIGKGLKSIENVRVVICPPFVYLPTLGASTFAPIHRSYGGSSAASAKEDSSSVAFSVGGQDCFWEEKGAFTGEISPKMLKDLGCQYVIIGHSERRRYFNETDEVINKKLNAAIIEKLNPILCIGETQQERKKGKTKEILKKQLKKAFSQIPATSYELPARGPLRPRSEASEARPKKGRQAISFVVAYEPIWAIGTGKACSPAEAKRAGDFIRSTASKIYNQKFAENLLILYGGSVNSQNAKSYIFEAGFQGLLIGGASLNPKEFTKIVTSINKY